jgi:hypothetical protein
MSSTGPREPAFNATELVASLTDEQCLELRALMEPRLDAMWERRRLNVVVEPYDSDVTNHSEEERRLPIILGTPSPTRFKVAYDSFDENDECAFSLKDQE